MTTPMVIHIVDDNDPVRDALSFALTVAGFQTAVYRDADDFLQRRENGRGVLICDIRMPGMNGFELTRSLRQECSELTMILVTGHFDKECQAHGKSAGANLILTKPVDLEELISEIARITA